MKAPCILVPLDASRSSAVALPVAKHLAELLEGTIHLLHVSTDTAAPTEVLRRIGVSTTEVRGSILSSRVGDPARGVLESADELDAGLIVMCTHTAASSPASEVLGHTARTVLERAPCPVVLVRPDRDVVPWPLRRVLLPHDGTPTTSAAIRPAVDLARAADAGLDVLHVACPGTGLPPERGALAPPRYVDQPQHEWPAWLGEFLERLDSIAPLASIDVRMWLARGVPGQEVLRTAAEQCDDLIVLAWHGAWEGKHASTVKAVLQGARAPVMICRARA